MSKRWFFLLGFALVVGVSVLYVETNQSTSVTLEERNTIPADEKHALRQEERDSDTKSLPKNISLLALQKHLAAAIRSGDLIAARRLMHDTVRCAWARQTIAHISESLEKPQSPSTGAAGVAESQRLDAMYESVSEAKATENNCSGISDAALEKLAYSTMLDAADLGDELAAQCFVAAAIPTSQFDDPEQTNRHLDESRRLVQTGIDRGDWHMAYVMELLSGSERPTSGWLWSLVAPDELEAYRYRALRWYGSDDDARAEIREKQISEQKKLLASKYSQTDIDKADKWAAQEYNDHFAHGQVGGDIESLCRNVYEIGSEPSTGVLN